MATFKVADPTPAVDDSTVPYEIRLGPAIEVWADPDQLKRFALLDPEDEGYADLEFKLQLSAKRRHGDAKRAWISERGLDYFDGVRLFTGCKPYWLAELGEPWTWADR